MMRKKYVLIFLIFLIIINCGLIFALPEVEVPESSIIYDVKGKVLKGIAQQNRISVDLNDISEDYLNAVVAVEDKNFYKHHGIDLGGILRAIFINIKERKIVAGGSTITQQTAKNLFLSNERTFLRKIKELVYAFQLERQYSKDEILQMYCNTIYFGQGAYGVEVAARTFFASSAKDLSLAEAALLAGLPQWPNGYNPYNNSDRAKQRQLQVLERMVDEGMIIEKEKMAAVEDELEYQKAEFIIGEAPYFVAMVREYLVEKYGESAVYQGGLRVYTTLDQDMQRAANTAVIEGMKNRDEELQVALVALDTRNGHIRAMVGGRDYYKSNFNRVFSYRQPGSTFKPFIYSLAVEWGITPADMYLCEKKEYELPNGDVYIPADHGKEPYHWKEFTLKEALMISDNVIAVKINYLLGPEHTSKHAQKFGFKNMKPILSLPLGSIEVRPIDMAAGYSVFSNGGVWNKPIYILKVEDKDGKVLEEKQKEQRKVVSSENAYIITDMLTGVLEPGGTASHLKDIVGRTAAAKTGTTDEFNDAWLVGYTPQLSCAVWVGFDRDRPANLVGGVAAGPIWAAFIHDASVKLTRKEFSKPANVKVFSICLDSGFIACEGCPRQIPMAFLENTEPKDLCYYHLSDNEWIKQNEFYEENDYTDIPVEWW